MALLNSTKDKRERVGRMVLMHANYREEIEEAYAGDIVAFVGLKDTRTGDTLCDPPKPVILEKMEFPEPVIEIAVEPNSKADQEKLGVGAAQARRRGSVLPRLDRPGIGPDDHQGHGRAAPRHQVDILMRAPYKIEVNVGAPQVAYRETIRAGRPRSTTRTRSRPAAPASSRASSSPSSRTRPAPASSSRTRSSAASVPKEYIPGVEKGLELGA